MSEIILIAIKIISDTYDSLVNKEIYETFDYAEFLKNNEKFKDAILYYSNVLNRVEKSHPLYVEATDGRGVAYERIGKWDEAERDLLASLVISFKASSLFFSLI